MVKTPRQPRQRQVSDQPTRREDEGAEDSERSRFARFAKNFRQAALDVPEQNNPERESSKAEVKDSERLAHTVSHYASTTLLTRSSR